MAKFTIKSNNLKEPNKSILTIKHNYHYAQKEKYKKIAIASIILNISLIIAVILTTIK